MNTSSVASAGPYHPNSLNGETMSKKSTRKHRKGKITKRERVNKPVHLHPVEETHNPIRMPDKVVIEQQSLVPDITMLYRGRFSWWDTIEGESREVTVENCKSAEEAHEELARKAIEQGWKRPASWNPLRWGETKPESESTVVKQSGRQE